MYTSMRLAKHRKVRIIAPAFSVQKSLTKKIYGWLMSLNRPQRVTTDLRSKIVPSAFSCHEQHARVFREALAQLGAMRQGAPTVPPPACTL